MGFRFFNPIYKTHLLFKLTTSSSSLHTPTKSLTLHINSLLQTSLYNTPHLTIHKRHHFGHSHHHHDEPSGGVEAEQVFRLGFASDIALASGKALTGYLSGSTAIIADAAHSISDVVLSGVAWWSYRVARAPKDKEHPYGHGKFETLGALGISGMLLATSGGIAWHAVDILQGLLASNPDISVLHGHHGHSGGNHHGIDMEHPILALNMTILSIAVKEGLYWITKSAGEKTGSELMKANAWHHRADAVSSIVALIGVGGSILGVKFLDPLAGLVVSGMILKAGIESGYQSVMELVDAGVPLPLLEPMRQTILQVEGVMGCHRLRGRRAGSCIYLDVHIEVDPFSSVSAAHDIGETVRHQIQSSHAQVAEVFIHIDPSVSKLSPSVADQQHGGVCPNVILQRKDIECIVHDVLSSKFSEIMVVERVTHHSLQSKLLLQIEVSMPSDVLIRDAMEVAKEAENEILKATPHINQVCIQLRLGQLIPQLDNES